ncbi:MAG: hypothetical protein K0R28_6031, partial [Paenibacillus sp.]|nr:hypothetical protein [Paenibacillus sp.]
MTRDEIGQRLLFSTMHRLKTRSKASFRRRSRLGAARPAVPRLAFESTIPTVALLATGSPRYVVIVPIIRFARDAADDFRFFDYGVPFGLRAYFVSRAEA